MAQGSGDGSVLQALEANDEVLASARLRSSGCLDDRDQHGNTALHYAAAYGYVALIDEMLIACIDLADVRNAAGQLPLLYAMDHGQPEAARLLWRQMKADNLVGQADNAQDEKTRFACYVAELCSIGVDWTLSPDEASSGFFHRHSCLEHRYHPRAREIGAQIHAYGGVSRMRDAASAVSDLLGKRAAHDLSAVWHRIGWEGTEEEYTEAAVALARQMAGSARLAENVAIRLSNTWLH